jgi:twitching motility protein PilT
MICTPAIRALIRDDKVHQIVSSMQGGKKFGMQTMNDSLYVHYLNREVALEECLRVSPDPNEFLRMTGEKPIEEQDIASAPAGGKLASARR